MRARIYQPARTAMSSGTAKTRVWLLEFSPAEARSVDPLMGWTSSDDTQSQVRLQFDTREAQAQHPRRWLWREFRDRAAWGVDPLRV